MNNCLCRRDLESELSVAVDGRNGESRVCFPEEPNCQPLGVLRETGSVEQLVGGFLKIKPSLRLMVPGSDKQIQCIPNIQTWDGLFLPY